MAVSVSVISDEFFILKHVRICYYYSSIVRKVPYAHLWSLVLFGGHGNLMSFQLDC